MRELAVPDSYVVDLVAHGDARGRFTEWYRADVLASALGHPLTLVQANHSVSARGVLRGVHFALVPPGQAKYVYCPAGRVLDVVVDVRDGSPTFGVHDSVVLDGEHAVYISRIRKDPTIANGLNLWCVSDNLRKGAALNAVQIAQLLHERGLLERAPA